MAEPTQFTFDLQEATIALLEKQNVTSGRWMLAFEFSISVGAFGSSPQNIKPGAMVQISKLQLTKAPDERADSPLVVDASKLKPAPAKTKTAERKS
ncbi:MAG: hypothetical protein ACR65U_01805 [Methylocystis sp.]